MDIYAPLNKLQGNELKVLKYGFFRPNFTLADDWYVYGALTYRGTWRRSALLATAQGNWVIQPKSIFSRTFIISNEMGESLGTIIPETWSRKINLQLNSGLEATFLNKKILSRTFSWTNTQYGDILSIKPNIWSYRNPFNVTLDTGLQPPIPETGLLTLLGIYLVLMRQAQAAAAQ